MNSGFGTEYMLGDTPISPRHSKLYHIPNRLCLQELIYPPNREPEPKNTRKYRNEWKRADSPFPRVREIQIHSKRKSKSC